MSDHKDRTPELSLLLGRQHSVQPINSLHLSDEERKSQASESDPAPEEKSPEPPKRDPIKFKEMLQAAMRAKLA